MKWKRMCGVTPFLSRCLLTFMLLVGGVMYPDWNQDKEDEQGPDDLNQQLDLREEGERSDVDVDDTS